MKLFIRTIICLVVVLLLGACKDVRGFKETLSVEGKEVSNLTYTGKYDIEIVGKYIRSKTFHTDNTSIVMIGDTMMIMSDGGEVQTKADKHYIVMNLNKNGETTPFKINVSESTYRLISSEQSLYKSLEFYNYSKDDATVSYVKIGDFYFLLRPYDSTVYEESYFEGEWYNLLYEMPHD